MKAVQLKDYGAENIVVQTDLQKPSPGNNQVLVEVQAASLNPFDEKLMKGIYKTQIPLKFPIILGGDFAGVVVSVGEEVTAFTVGDLIYGSAQVLSGGSGSLAEFLISNVKNSAHQPKNIDFYSAAALPLVGSSAIQALEEHIKLQPGQKILIHGGAGGIGHIAIQLAQALRGTVATTVSSDDKEFVKNLGADEVIDYKTQSFETILHDYDAVFDTVGGKVTDLSFQILKPGGILVSMVNQPSHESAQKYNVTAIYQQTKTNTAHLERLAYWVEQDKIKVTLDKLFSLQETQAAFRQLNSHPRGKVVIQVSP